MEKEEEFAIEEITKIIKKKLRNGKTKFSYVKNNGDLRIAIGTLNLDIIPEENHPTGNSNYDNENVIRYFDLEKNSWRSFNIDKLVNIYADTEGN